MAIIDQAALRQLASLGTPFVPIGGSAPLRYLNSSQEHCGYGHLTAMPKVLGGHYQRLQADAAAMATDDAARTRTLGLATLVHILLHGRTVGADAVVMDD